METCVNCACEFSDPYQNSDEDLKPVNVYESLSTIYKLNYLTAFVDSENTEIWKLCENCLIVFTNLQQFYEDFNQLRSLQSKLAIEIQKLDDCLQPRHTDHPQQQQETLIIKEEEEEAENDLSHNPPHPRVILHRLENDDAAQKFLANLKCTGRKRSRKSNPLGNQPTYTPLSPPPPPPKIIKSNINLKCDEQLQEADKKNVYHQYHPLFVPNSEEEEEEYEEGDEDLYEMEKMKVEGEDSDAEKIGIDSDDEYYPIAKRQKQVQNIAHFMVGKVILPSNDPGLVERREYRKTAKYVYYYKRRKTKVPNPCWECDMDFPTQEECYEHTMKEHFQPDDHVCQDCSRMFDKLQGLRFHEQKGCVQLNPGELIPMLKCEICEERGKEALFLEYEYKKHLQQVHSESQDNADTIAERTCQVCQKVLKSKKSKNLHYRNLHTPEGMAKYKEKIKANSRRQGTKDDDKPGPNEETFCSVCMLDMRTHTDWVVHQKSAHAELLGSFVCDECGKSFIKNSALLTHKAFVHSEEALRPAGSVYVRVTHDKEGK